MSELTEADKEAATLIAVLMCNAKWIQSANAIVEAGADTAKLAAECSAYMQSIVKLVGADGERLEAATLRLGTRLGFRIEQGATMPGSAMVQ